MRPIREQHSTIVSRRLEAESTGGMREALDSIEQLTRVARGRLRDRVVDVGAPEGEGTSIRLGSGRQGPALGPPMHVSPTLLERHQLAAHALAHLSTEIEACRALAGWADERGGAERALAEASTGVLLLALRGGVDLGGGEVVPLGELELHDDEVGKAIGHPAIVSWARHAGSGAALAALARAAAERSGLGEGGGRDARLGWIRDNMRGFVERLVVPLAPEIHRRNGLIPEALIRRMGEFGVFRLSVAPEHGGDGLGASATAAAVEELARGSLAFGVLAATTALAAELIHRAGTESQRRSWLPRIAAGDARCAVALAEPTHGVDLARTSARAERQPDGSYLLTGKKAWVTGACRADLVLTLASTPPRGRAGEPAALPAPSVFAVSKRRGEHGADFVDPGLVGVEVRALGQRGMGHYELRFDGLRLEREALLGEREGAGMEQLSQTEGVGHVHAAACAVGLAQAALDHSIHRAKTRVQSGAPLLCFPRVAHRLGGVLARVAAARQLTRAAAQAADAGQVGGVEAAMARLFATRVAWEAADACMQIHGANGYADGSVAARLLLDARGLSLHLGTSELLAHGLARTLLEGA